MRVVLTLQLGILGLMDGTVKGCVREVSLAPVSCILYVYVAPPTQVGVLSMVLGLRRHIECYNYDYCSTFNPAAVCLKMPQRLNLIIIIMNNNVSFVAT